MTIRLCLLAVLVLVGVSPAAAQSLPPATLVARIGDSLGADFVAQDRSPSVAIGLVRGRDTITLKAWGMADLEHQVPATAQSVYRIGSVTKQFTAAAIMQLVDEGKLRLDDSIAQHLDSLPLEWRAVTVRQLLNHTSGIPSYTDVGERWRNRWGEEMTPAALVAMTATDSMWFAPGSRYRYDNTGYVLLGMLIEKASRRSWGEDLSRRFARPMQLAATRDCRLEPVIPHRVRGYDRRPNGWVNAPYLAMSQPYAAGAMCSTIGDLARWNRALHTGGVVSPESYQQMITPVGAAARSAYGFGLGRDTLAGETVITHGGGIHGFVAANAWAPSAELSVTVLANTGSAPVEELAKQLVRAALGVPLAQAPRPVPLEAAAMRRYAGVYALELPTGVFDFTVAESGGALTGQLAGQQAIPIVHFGNHTFGADFDPTLRLVFRIEGDRASGLTLYQRGGQFEGVRK